MIDQRFFSFNKKSDWERGQAYNLHKHGNELRINQLEKYRLSRTLRFSNPTDIQEIRDFSLGDQHSLYLLDRDRNVWIYDWINHFRELLISAGDDQRFGFTMIDSMGKLLFLAGIQAEDKIAAYSAANGQKIWSLDTWNRAPLRPLAIHSDGSEYVYVLTPSAKGVNEWEKELKIRKGTALTILKIHRTGKVVQELAHHGLFLQNEAMLKSISTQFILTASHTGRVLLLDKATRVMYSFSAEGELLFQTSIVQSIRPSSVAFDAGHNMFIGESREVTEQEEDRFIIKLSSHGEFLNHVSALRGCASKIRIDGQSRMFVLNGETNEISLLELQLRTSETTGLDGLKGVFLSFALDSTEEEMEWHKILLDAHIPEETQIKLSYFASDRREFFLKDQYVQLDDFIRNKDVSMKDKLEALQPVWQDTLTSPRDALIFKAVGRYLWLKIEFVGSEFNTPILKSIRLYFPKSTYLSYLPAVYQEDRSSKDFLERYLALFHTLYSELDHEISHISRYFDPDVVSGPFLQWLSTWLGISAEDRWTEQQLRQLIRYAPELYRFRGTKAAIEKMVAIFTGKRPLIIEFFQYKQMRKDIEVRKIVDRLYGSDPYTFSVLVEQKLIKSERERIILERILEEQKPAFTEVKLILLEETIYLDMFSYLGMNTYLTEPSLMVLNPQSSMPHHTLLVDLDQDNRLDTHTRLGLDSELE